MTFGKWPEPTHQSLDQQKRIVSSKLPKVMPLNINKDSLTGVFCGSRGEVYDTSLESCTCSDFKTRKLPCKHIYRLAIECGLMDAALKPKACPMNDITLAESVSILESYLEATQVFIKELLRHITRSDAGIVLLECNKLGKIIKPITGFMLVDILPCPFFDFSLAPPDIVMGKMLKRDIVEILKRRGNIPEGKMTKETLVNWCIKNLPDIPGDLPQIIIVSCTSSFQKVHDITYRYLRRKYEWNMLLSEDEAKNAPVFYPFDAEFRNSDVCFFPDDEISELLSKYGHNRCTGGFDVTKQGPGRL